jgi:hypothetical protein
MEWRLTLQRVMQATLQAAAATTGEDRILLIWTAA